MDTTRKFIPEKLVDETMTFDAGLGLEWPLIPYGGKQQGAFLIDPAPLIKGGLKIEKLQKWQLETQQINAADGKLQSISRLRLGFILP